MKNKGKKVCLISDTHWGKKKGATFMIESMERYFKSELIPYLVQNQINKCFILGDFYDNRTSVDVRVSNVVLDVLKEFKLKNIEVVMLLGNHDVFFNSSIDIHSLSFFELFDNVTIIDRITEMDVYGVPCVFFPWQTDNLFQSRKYDAKLAFGHFAINGCKLTKKEVFEGGSSQTFFHDNFDKTFTGHFHQPGEYVSTNGSEIVYIGSPYHLDRNDANEDRGVIILDVETLEWKRVFSKTTMKYISINYGADLTELDIPGNVIDVHIGVNENYDQKSVNRYISLIEEYEYGLPLKVNLIPHYEYKDLEKLTTEEMMKVKSVPDMLNMKLKSMDISDKIKSDTLMYLNNLISSLTIDK